MSTQLRKSKIENMLAYICTKWKIHYETFMDDIVAEYPDILNPKNCANCGASMNEYIYTLDSLDCLLLLGMGKIVKTRLEVGMPFTDANQVHLQKELNDYYSVPSRSTQCSKLGLIAKIKTKAGKHDRSKGWLITSRGFDFLAGKRIPKKVRVWRRKIEEHFDDTITLLEAQEIHKDLIMRQIAAKKDPKGDYRREFEAHNPADWYEIAGPHEGKLL